MPRRRLSKKRSIPPDAVYNSQMVAKFLNKLMQRGKKSLAEKIFYQTMKIVEEKTGEPPLKIFKKAVEGARPRLVVKSRRVGGATYQVPVEVVKDRGISLSMRWIISFSKQRKGRSMVQKLAAELIDAANNTGSAVKKKDDTHRMAEANKAFAHYRW
ncbi:MAG: 30S ribosomal protein S7 [bacterium]|nr:30S ribosomal protein S7 [bacterium]